MIDLARASITEIERRVERIDTELDSLNALRAAWERYLALSGAPIETPPSVAGGPGARPGRRGGTGGRAATGQGAGEKRPAASSTSNGHAEVPAPVAATFRCDQCDATFDRNQKLASHRWSRHRLRGTQPAQPTTARSEEAG